MAEIREVLYQHYKGAKQRGIEKSLGVSRNSIRKYISMATDLGYRSSIGIDELEAIALQVHNKIIAPRLQIGLMQQQKNLKRIMKK